MLSFFLIINKTGIIKLIIFYLYNYLYIIEKEDYTSLNNYCYYIITSFINDFS